MSTEPAKTVTLYGATDKTGRLYLTDNKETLPAEALDIRELQVAPETMEWNILSVQMQEIRLIPVSIHVGDFVYATPPPPDLTQWLEENRKEAA